jgi:hypothetical protein
MFFKVKYTFPAVGDFVICSSALLRTLPNLFDETFINGGEDVDFSISIYITGCTYHSIDYKIKSVGGASLGNKGRMLKDVLNLSYLSYKTDKIYMLEQKLQKGINRVEKN